MGRFAAAFVVIEIFALICSLGEKRGLAQRLTEGAEDEEGPPANLVFDGMLTSLLFSLVACALLVAFPVSIFPSGTNSDKLSQTGRFDLGFPINTLNRTIRALKLPTPTQ